jgi:hypothetical protein
VRCHRGRVGQTGVLSYGMRMQAVAWISVTECVRARTCVRLRV